MQSFTFYSPTKIIFGKGTENEAAKEIKRQGGRRVLVVYGSGSAKKSGLLSHVEKSLTEENLFFVPLGGVLPNPRIELVREGIALAQKENLDFVLAVGGGSVIDTAKSIALGALNPEFDIWDDFFIGQKRTGRALQVGCILTISAAGSETSDGAVVTNGNAKRSYMDPLLIPRFSILNPELTYTLPKYHIAAGCVDIMMHTMERYFSPILGNGVSDLIAFGVLKTIVKYAPVAVIDPTNHEAQSEIMWAGAVSQNNLSGLGSQEDWATRQFGKELSGMFDSIHGATLSATWGSWARYVYRKNPSRFAAYGYSVFQIEPTGNVSADALSAIERTEAFFRSIGMPTGIKALVGALTEEQLKKLTESCTYFGTRRIGSFYSLGYDEILEVYQMANSY